ncbi:MAG: helicase associated domain-containing protein [Kofleriaceae bacterium]
MTTSARRNRKGARSRAEAYQQRRDNDHLYKLSLLREFVSEHGWKELRNGTCHKGVALHNWVHLRRTEYKTGEIRDFLIPLVEAIPGWSWDPVRDRYRRNVDNLRAFVRANGWGALTSGTNVEDVALAQWCANRRQEYRRGTLPAWLARALEAIPGWSWEPAEEHYEDRLRALREHVERHGWDGFRLETIDRHGNRLGRWATHVRVLHRSGRLPQWVQKELDAIEGWTWEPRLDRQARNLDHLRRFIARHGWDELHKSTVVDGVRLGTWVVNCRHRYKHGTISDKLRRSLDSVPGWVWGDERR